MVIVNHNDFLMPNRDTEFAITFAMDFFEAKLSI